MDETTKRLIESNEGGLHLVFKHHEDGFLLIGVAEDIDKAGSLMVEHGGIMCSFPKGKMFMSDKAANKAYKDPKVEIEAVKLSGQQRKDD